MNSNLRTSNDLEAKLRDLVKVYVALDSDKIETLTKKFKRRLRPSYIDDSHTAVARRNLRSYILRNALNETEATVTISRFEKLCEQLHSSNPRLYSNYIVYLESTASKPSIKLDLLNSTVDMTTTYLTEESTTQAASNMKKTTYLDDANTSGVSTASSDSSSFNTPIYSDNMTFILKDLIYIFQDLPGKYIKYDNKNERYIIDSTLLQHPPSHDIVLEMCEMAWLYKQITTFIKETGQYQSMKGLTVQAFCHAIQDELQDYHRLLAVLDKEINNMSLPPNNTTSIDNIRYNNKVINSTSAITLLKLRAWMRGPQDRMSHLARLIYATSSLQGGALLSRLFGHTKYGDEKTVIMIHRIIQRSSVPFFHTLKRWILYGELIDPFQEFFIYIRTEIPLHTCNIWHDLYRIRETMIPSFLQADLAMKIYVIGKSINFISRYKHTIQPSNTTGNTTTKQGGMSGNRKGEKSNRRQSTMTAPSISEALGYKSSETKSATDTKLTTVNRFDEMRAQAQDYVKNFTKPHSSSSETTAHNTQKEDTIEKTSTSINMSLSQLSYDNESILSEIITNISEQVDQKLLHLLINDFQLLQHLLALKKFMLLGQGDFVTCLMDSVGPELQKSPSKLYRHNLSGNVESALRSSNAQYEPAYILNRISVRLLEAAPGDTGWEVFTLDYAIDAPLNAVIHNDAISKYRVAFHMLWRLKRVEWTLSAAWKQLMTLSHSAWRGYGRDGREAWRKEFPKLLPVLHRCNMNRGRMSHVVNNLGAYLMFEVLESAWLHLQSQITTAKSLDAIISAHDEYLNDILYRGLLTPTHETLNMQVQLLLQSIFRFCHLESALVTEAAVAMSRKRLAKEERERQYSSMRSTLSTSNSPIGATTATTSNNNSHISQFKLLDSSQQDSYDGVPVHMVTRVDEAIQEYTNQYQLLMKLLKEQGERSEDFIKFLTFRLDFNNFYSKVTPSI